MQFSLRKASRRFASSADGKRNQRTPAPRQERPFASKSLRRKLRLTSYAALTAMALLTVAAVFAAPAFAEDTAWKKREHDCKAAFSKPGEAAATLIELCADLFAVHGRLHLMGSGERDGIRKGLRWLYENAPERASLIARDGLFRLGVRLPIRTDAPATVASGGAPARERYDPPEAPKAEQKDAEQLAESGVKDLLKKRYARGAEKLQRAIKTDPRSEYAIYNFACSQSLLKNRDVE